jgi:hypothetical protein
MSCSPWTKRVNQCDKLTMFFVDLDVEIVIESSHITLLLIEVYIRVMVVYLL